MRVFLVVFDKRGAFGAAGLLRRADEGRDETAKLLVMWMAANALLPVAGRAESWLTGTPGVPDPAPIQGRASMCLRSRHWPLPSALLTSMRNVAAFAAPDSLDDRCQLRRTLAIDPQQTSRDTYPTPQSGRLIMVYRERGSTCTPMAFKRSATSANAAGCMRSVRRSRSRHRFQFSVTKSVASRDAPGSSSNPNSNPQLHISKEPLPSCVYGA